MQQYNLYQEHANKLFITPSRIIQLQIINFKSAANIFITPSRIIQLQIINFKSAANITVNNDWYNSNTCPFSALFQSKYSQAIYFS